MEISWQTTFVLAHVWPVLEGSKVPWLDKAYPSAHSSSQQQSVFVYSLRKGIKIFKFTFQLLQIELARFCNIGDQTAVTNKMMIP